MGQIDAGNENIVRENAELIHRTVMAIAASEYIPDLEKILTQAESNGWTSLVGAIRKILEGERDVLNLTGLDEEDRAIATAILQGIEDPLSLPDLTNAIDPAVGGPLMANIIHDVAIGNTKGNEALKILNQQMVGTNDDYSRIPDVVNLMVAGERREDVLCKDMGVAGVSLVQVILKELKNLEV